MGLSCWRYKLYDWAKQTFPGRWLFYSGQRFQHFGPITVTGTVKDCVHSATDGDVCYDLLAEDGTQFHCELTPCQSSDLHKTAMALKVGDKVQVSGTKTFDPPHRILWKKFNGGNLEIHPVESIVEVK